MIYQIFKHAHSGLRWFVLLFIVLAIVNSIVKLIKQSEYSQLDKKLSLYTFMFMNLQFVIGFVLYFISSKVVFSGDSMSSDLLRFFLVEHLGMMLIAVALISIGYSKAKKALTSQSKFKKTLIFFGIGLLIILLAIPWPWQQLSAAWI